MIPPETFPVEIVRDSIPVPSQSAEPETLGWPGNDFSEIYSLRGYEPGDDVKRIHWKLTEKTDEVLVREGSRPQEDEVLLYWDRTGNTVPAVADALAECVTSVGLALLQSRLRFVFCLKYPDGYSGIRVTGDSRQNAARQGGSGAPVPSGAGAVFYPADGDLLLRRTGNAV